MNPTEIEVHAMRNDPLPAGLELPEQLLFLAFRALHQSVRFGQVTREQAHNEKTQLLDRFTDWMRWDGIYRDTCKMRVELGGLTKKMTVSDCPTCKKAIAVIDGRK